MNTLGAKFASFGKNQAIAQVSYRNNCRKQPVRPSPVLQKSELIDIEVYNKLKVQSFQKTDYE
jgi:hypothetical protein